MWCKKATTDRKREEIYFMLKALQFKSGSRDSFNILRIMIYLSFRSIISAQNIERLRNLSRNYSLEH